MFVGLKRSRHVLIMVIGLASLFGGYKIYSIYMGPDEPKEIKVVEVEKVALKNISQTASLIGTIQAKRSTVLVAKATGFLEHVAHAGEEIKKGGLIAKLDNNDIEKNYILTESAEKIAKDQYDRRVALQKGNVSSQKDVEDSRNNLIETQKALSNAKIEFDKTRFEAPFDGIVGVFKIREGTIR